MNLERRLLFNRPAAVDAVRDVRVEHVAIGALTRADGDTFSHLDDRRVIEAVFFREGRNRMALTFLVPNT